MIEPLPDLPEGVLGFRAVGTVDAADYRKVLDPAIDAWIAKGKKVNLVYVLGAEFSRYSLSALWQDMLLEGKPEHSWGRVALVTDHRILGELVKGLGSLSSAELRRFKLSELPVALDWAAGKDAAAAAS
ncbi:STAS/SEC14 domain-containing protein [Microbacterium sp. 4R-513]|uniref:STAS/SEC14 domain-containing protein n=1 Tax=Microbacterium sp. 4R-513 TaxID=2567934 RepID=UPI0013E1541B|nr:STAS/SEC14 domain-containing protein [Microbacterium sp. 4R-513]QIG39673.1 STAS/SEC14 domain-containing protein [Microbacterium sp. 4R-513]